MALTLELLNPQVLNHVSRDLQKVGLSIKRPGAFRQPFEQIRDEIILPSIKQNFASQGRPTRWPPLAIDTIMWRATHGRGMRRLRFTTAASEAYVTGAFAGRILIFTRKLINAATAKARVHIKDNVMTYGNFPSEAWYAVVHQRQAVAQRAKIPHRPFVVMQNEDINGMIEIMGDWLEQVVERNMQRHYR